MALHHRAALAFVVGTALFVGAAFVAPDGVLPKYRYEVAELDPADGSAGGDVYGAAAHSSSVLHCRGPHDSRPCLLEWRVHERGRLVVDADSTDAFRGSRAGYRIVLLEDGEPAYVRPNATRLGNGSVALVHEPVSPETALDEIAFRAGARNERIVRLFEQGHVRTAEGIEFWDRWRRSGFEAVEYEGRYFVRGGFAYDGGRARTETAIRLAVALLGLGLVVYGSLVQSRAIRRARTADRPD